jgi:hypothetical protein
LAVLAADILITANRLPDFDPLRAFATAAIMCKMKTYWFVVLALGVADAAAAALLLLQDGGPEALVWWTFLIIPLVIAALIVGGIILHPVIRLSRWMGKPRV